MRSTRGLSSAALPQVTSMAGPGSSSPSCITSHTLSATITASLVQHCAGPASRQGHAQSPMQVEACTAPTAGMANRRMPALLCPLVPDGKLQVRHSCKAAGILQQTGTLHSPDRQTHGSGWLIWPRAIRQVALCQGDTARPFLWSGYPCCTLQASSIMCGPEEGSPAKLD